MTSPNSLATAGTAARLRLLFEQPLDRWQQTLQVEQELGSVTVGTSLEGTAADRWPASPALQSLHFENQGPGKDVALLVGQAGRSHWSASVATTGTNELEFDHACRVQEPPEFLGCTYELAEGWQIVATEQGCRLTREQTVLEITPLHGAKVSCAGNHLQIAAVTNWGGKQQTARWGWRLLLLS